MFSCAAAAAAIATTNHSKWFLSGHYHPPLGNKDGGLLQAIGAANVNGGAAIDGETLTIALDVVQTWAVMLTLGFTLIIFFFLAFCICSKKDAGYDEFEITQGITTVKMCRDGGENGVSLINGSGTLASMKATEETSEASSRYTLKRELPAIPRQDGKSGRPASRHSTDHYTSVSEPLQGGSNLKLVGGVQVLPSGAMAPGGRAVVVKECSIPSPEDKMEKDKSGGAAESKKGHHYSQVTKPEHAYAKVVERPDEAKAKPVIIQDRRSKEQDGRYKSTQSEKRPEASNLSEKSSMIQTSASMKTSSYLPQSTALRSPQEAPIPESNIPAALAISGRQRANEEMPYMTPAVLQAGRGADQQQPQQQQNFSGDSQDSRGYTSISVREPLAALKARQAAEKSAIKGIRNGSEAEGYYATVSDDSADETYACIYEGGSRGGSETYARIEPATVQSLSNLPQSPTQQPEQSPPAPPSVDSLKNVVHSRQASAGSATSTGMGSPVADKRGARSSPLPPLPQGDPSLYSPAEPTNISSQSVPKSPPKATAQFAEISSPRSLEEMYAKVNKKSSSRSRGKSGGENGSEGISMSPSASCDVMQQSLVETRTHEKSSLVAGGGRQAKSCEVSSSSWGSKDDSSNRMSGNYESIPSAQSLYSGGGSSDPGYETVKNGGEPPYASVGYETVRGSSDMESEPGYETVKHKEPGYETVSEYPPKKDDPGYETVLSRGISDPGYESVRDERKEDYDPGYEELSHPRTSSETDPNYEQLKFVGSDNLHHGYEEIVKKKQQDDQIEGNYELVSNYETQEKVPPPPLDVFADLNIPLYASVQKKKSSADPTSSGDEPPKDDNEKMISGESQIDEDPLDKFLNNLPSSKPAKTEREFSLTQEMITLQEDHHPPPTSSGFLVMDSPDEVEVPSVVDLLPETFDAKEESLIDLPQEFQSPKLSEEFTRPPPPKIVSEIPKIDKTSSEDNFAVVAPPLVSFTSPSPPKTSSDESSEEVKTKEESPLPPPPLSSLDEVTTSPPPPPPPFVEDGGGGTIASLLEFSPPPPPLSESTEVDVTSPILPPPSSCIDGDGMTVTVNPMGESGVTVADLMSQPSEDDTTSGTGNGSVDSVVTVDAKTGSDPATVPAESGKHGDEARTPV